MRLQGAAMVRNEGDIIEAFVRHNLAFLDTLTIVDNDSVDGTSEILAKLQAEGLPLRVSRDPTIAYRQSDTMTALAREALSGDGADFVFALDADEFLKVESRTSLERALAAVPANTHAAMHWLTYVPDSFDSDSGAFGPGHLWWRLKTERNSLRKVIVGRILLDRPEDVLSTGSHVVHGRELTSVQPHALMREGVVALAHCPVRSRAQLEGKIIVGYLAHLVAQAEGAHHWRALYAELRDGATITEDRLREIACNYGSPRGAWLPQAQIELVEDPVRLSGELRYRGEARSDALHLLMRYTESLIASMQTAP